MNTIKGKFETEMTIQTRKNDQFLHLAEKNGNLKILQIGRILNFHFSRPNVGIDNFFEFES